MAFTGLKKKTAIQSLEKQLKKLKGNGVVPTKIEKIGILADSRLFGSYDITRNLRQKFDMPNQKIEVIIHESLKDDFVSQHYSTFSEKDFGMYGKIKNSNITGFIDNTYDLLINYCNHDSVFTNLVAIKTKAKFKVGFFNKELQSIYDFTIDTEGNKVDVFNDELAKYLKILKLV